jgi:hypothetical protein
MREGMGARGVSAAVGSEGGPGKAAASAGADAVLALEVRASGFSDRSAPARRDGLGAAGVPLAGSSDGPGSTGTGSGAAAGSALVLAVRAGAFSDWSASAMRGGIVPASLAVVGAAVWTA